MYYMFHTQWRGQAAMCRLRGLGRQPLARAQTYSNDVELGVVDCTGSALRCSRFLFLRHADGDAASTAATTMQPAAPG